MSRAERRSAKKAPRPPPAFSTPFGVAVIDKRTLPPGITASSAAMPVKNRPPRETQATRLRSHKP